jgi:hypothetical protein
MGFDRNLNVGTAHPITTAESNQMSDKRSFQFIKKFNPLSETSYFPYLVAALIYAFRIYINITVNPEGIKNPIIINELIFFVVLVLSGVNYLVHHSEES